MKKKESPDFFPLQILSLRSEFEVTPSNVRKKSEFKEESSDIFAVGEGLLTFGFTLIIRSNNKV